MKLIDKIKKLSDKELLMVGKQHKVENMVNSGQQFQRRYTLILEELKRRGLLR